MKSRGSGILKPNLPSLLRDHSTTKQCVIVLLILNTSKREEVNIISNVGEGLIIDVHLFSWIAPAHKHLVVVNDTNG